MKKAEIRNIFKQKRNALTEQQAELYSQKIHDLLFSRIMMHRFSPIHLFMPIKGKNEPNSILILNTLIRDFSPDIFLSKTLPHHQLMHFKFKNYQSLHTNTWGIQEPTDDGEGLNSEQFFKKYAHEDILILVPLLAFDKKGHRVGYGKGFYDQFLQHKTQKTTLIGLSYFEPVEIITDFGEHDIPLHFCITPDRVWSF